MFAALGDERYSAVANIGHRPSFDNGLRNIEVHILNFDEDIYGCDLVVEFVQFLRPEERFQQLFRHTLRHEYGHALLEDWSDGHKVDEDLYLVSDETPEPGDMLNHSCEPNAGLKGSALLVAMRDIAVGEEITFDYAMCDASDYDEFSCMCGVPTCRQVVTGADWRDPVLQAKYDGWFSPYLMKRIAALPTV